MQFLMKSSVLLFHLGLLDLKSRLEAISPLIAYKGISLWVYFCGQGREEIEKGHMSVRCNRNPEEPSCEKSVKTTSLNQEN